MVTAQQTGFDGNPMVDMMWGLMNQQFNNLPPAAKEALSQLEVRVARQGDRVVIKPVSLIENNQTEKMKEIMLDGFVDWMPQMIEKAFHVKVKRYKDK
ncbi:MAG: hypothetical protein PHI12_04480 [Dehalococcoidales bacterium]|nr:hypothetical protein [Dehalococcoidales bacterium]